MRSWDGGQGGTPAPHPLRAAIPGPRGVQPPRAALLSRNRSEVSDRRSVARPHPGVAPAKVPACAPAAQPPPR